MDLSRAALEKVRVQPSQRSLSNVFVKIKQCNFLKEWVTHANKRSPLKVDVISLFKPMTVSAVAGGWGQGARGRTRHPARTTLSAYQNAAAATGTRSLGSAQRVSKPHLGPLFLGGICSSGQETEIRACPGKKDLLGWVQLKNPPELLVACRAGVMKLEALGFSKTWTISLSRFLPDSEAAGEIDREGKKLVKTSGKQNRIFLSLVG